MSSFATISMPMFSGKGFFLSIDANRHLWSCRICAKLIIQFWINFNNFHNSSSYDLYNLYTNRPPSHLLFCSIVFEGNVPMTERRCSALLRLARTSSIQTCGVWVCCRRKSMPSDAQSIQCGVLVLSVWAKFFFSWLSRVIIHYVTMSVKSQFNYVRKRAMIMCCSNINLIINLNWK